MYFLTALRGTGMGNRLLHICLQHARNLGYRLCYLETLQSMSHARHLYGKYGFKKLDSSMGSTGHTSCNAWMSCKLC